MHPQASTGHLCSLWSTQRLLPPARALLLPTNSLPLTSSKFTPVFKLQSFRSCTSWKARSLAAVSTDRRVSRSSAKATGKWSCRPHPPFFPENKFLWASLLKVDALIHPISRDCFSWVQESVFQIIFSFPHLQSSAPFEYVFNPNNYLQRKLSAVHLLKLREPFLKNLPGFITPMSHFWWHFALPLHHDFSSNWPLPHALERRKAHSAALTQIIPTHGKGTGLITPGLPSKPRVCCAFRRRDKPRTGWAQPLTRFWKREAWAGTTYSYLSVQDW